MGVFLPAVLQSVESNRHQYLLLAALKEVIVVFANLQLNFLPYLPSVLPVLLR